MQELHTTLTLTLSQRERGHSKCTIYRV